MSQYQKGKTNLDLLEQETLAIVSAGPYANLHIFPKINQFVSAVALQVAPSWNVKMLSTVEIVNGHTLLLQKTAQNGCLGRKLRWRKKSHLLKQEGRPVGQI